MGVVVQSQLAIAITIVAFVLHVKCKPFSNPLLNRLETISLSSFGVTAWIGVLMSDENVSYTMKVAGSFIIVIINIVAFVYMLWHFLIQAGYYAQTKLEVVLEEKRRRSRESVKIELTEVEQAAAAKAAQEAARLTL